MLIQSFAAVILLSALTASGSRPNAAPPILRGMFIAGEATARAIAATRYNDATRLISKARAPPSTMVLVGLVHEETMTSRAAGTLP